MKMQFSLSAIRARGFRPFRDVLFRFNRLELIIGANGAGKSALFEFLRFIRESVKNGLPLDLLGGPAARKYFYKPGPNKLFWNAQIDYNTNIPIFYQAEVEGGVGAANVEFERIITKKALDKIHTGGFSFLDFRDGKGLVRDPSDGEYIRKEYSLRRGSQLGLGAITDATLKMLHDIKDYILDWRFYNNVNVNFERMRRPAPIASAKYLDEDGGNISAVLFTMMNEEPEAFADLKSLMMFALPGFQNLEVKSCGGAGEIMAFWKEDGVETELSLADLSDGILRFIMLVTLCVMPDPPPLICIDDMGQGLHPRTLPMLSGIFEKAADRTQLLLATHDSYLISQFDTESLSVLKKTPEGSVFNNARNSHGLISRLRKADSDEIERMFRADELEGLL